MLGSKRYRFEKLFSRHHRKVFKLAWRLCGFNASDAEDVTQETFLRAYRAYERYSDRDREYAWLRIICINIVRERWRRQQFFSRHLEMRANEICSSGWIPSPDTAAVTAQRMERVLQMLDTLKPEYREALVLKHFTGLEDREIAEIQKIEVATVRSRIRRARDSLTAQILNRKES